MKKVNNVNEQTIKKLFAVVLAGLYVLTLFV